MGLNLISSQTAPAAGIDVIVNKNNNMSFHPNPRAGDSTATQACEIGYRRGEQR